jgi:hypothetical protein
MNNQLKDYISYRIQRAYDTLNDAKILAGLKKVKY